MTRSSVAGGLGILTALAAPPLHAVEASAERPLLVTVEVEPGAGADAAQVRRAIGDELGRPVVGPGDQRAVKRPGERGPDVLLVAVSRERIVLSMRHRSDETVARELPAPADRASRLRTITWLAGNLARDQATPFLVADMPASIAAPEAPPVPAPAPAPPTEPPPAAQPPAPSAREPAPAVVAASAPELGFQSPTAPFWSIALSGGVAAMMNDFSVAAYGSTYGATHGPVVLQADVLKHRPDGWMWGAGLDFGPEHVHGLGVAALGGIEKRWRRVMVDLTLGIGIQTSSVSNVTTTSSSTGFESTTSTGNQIVTYGRAGGTLAVGLTPAWEVFTRVSAGGQFVGGGDLFIVALGVRRNLP